MSLSRYKKYFTDPYYSIGNMWLIHSPKTMPDAYYLRVLWKNRMGYPLDLKNPKTFNEKIQWLKLYDRNPLYIKLADKVEVKKWVANKIGEKYVVPTIGVYDKPEQIEWSMLPSQFVLKCNHDYGSVIICKDKKKFDKQAAIQKLNNCLSRNFWWYYREWVYKNIPPKILVETYMEQENGELNDYKFLCFGGKSECSFVCTNRNSNNGMNVTFFDREWNRLPFERTFKASLVEIPKPSNYDLMLHLAESLSLGFRFVRVDFFEVKGNVYFGEMTFYPGAGFEAFQPTIWDERIGEWLFLNK